MKKQNKKTNEIPALIRFSVSMVVLTVLVLKDLGSHETIPNIVYILIGGMNGLDAYKLYNDVKRGYDEDSNKE